MSDVTKLNTALAQALGDLSEPHKGGKADTGSYGYTYLTLPDLSRVVRQAFATHGLGFTQHVHVVEGGVEVTTRLVHTSGATWMSDPLWMPAGSRNAQAIGSAITYARRYQLAALVGLSGSDDDDGAQAASEEPRASRSAPRPLPQPTGGGSSLAKTGPQGDAPQTDAQRRRLWATARAKGYGDKAELAAFVCGLLDVDYDTDRLSHLSKAEASRVIDALQAVEVADREQPAEPPADPWAGAEQETMAGE